MEGIMTYKSKAQMHGFGLTAKTQKTPKSGGCIKRETSEQIIK